MLKKQDMARGDILRTTMTNSVVLHTSLELKNMMQLTPFNFLQRPRDTEKEANRIAGRRLVGHPRGRQEHEQ